MSDEILYEKYTASISQAVDTGHGIALTEDSKGLAGRRGWLAAEASPWGHG
jgi:hypothetical protein